MSLEVENLAFGYPGKPVGQDASFRLAEGEVICRSAPTAAARPPCSRRFWD